MEHQRQEEQYVAKDDDQEVKFVPALVLKQVFHQTNHPYPTPEVYRNSHVKRELYEYESGGLCHLVAVDHIGQDQKAASS